MPLIYICLTKSVTIFNLILNSWKNGKHNCIISSGFEDYREIIETKVQTHFESLRSKESKVFCYNAVQVTPNTIVVKLFKLHFFYYYVQGLSNFHLLINDFVPVSVMIFARVLL